MRSRSDHEWNVAMSGRRAKLVTADDTIGDSGSCTWVTSGANRATWRTTRRPAVGASATGATERLYGRAKGRPTSTTLGAEAGGYAPRRGGANTGTSCGSP